MKYMTKKIFLYFFLIAILFIEPLSAKDQRIEYSRNDISDYFYGIISVSKNNTNTAYQYLDRIQFYEGRISSQVAEYLPYVNVISVNIEENEIDFNKLAVKVVYEIPSLDEEDVLIL